MSIQMDKEFAKALVGNAIDLSLDCEKAGIPHPEHGTEFMHDGKVYFVTVTVKPSQMTPEYFRQLFDQEGADWSLEPLA